MIHGLPILMAVVNETLRMFPVFPLLDRLAGDDIHISTGGVIKKGKRIFFLYHNINRDPAMYDDPEKYDPSRFLVKAEAGDSPGGKKKVKWPKYEHSSFGAGRRACPGAEFAIIETMCFLARLLYGYQIEFPVGIEPKIEEFSTVQPGLEAFANYPEVIFRNRRDLKDLLE